MKYMLTWTERPQGSPIEYENAQKRILEVFRPWKASAGFKIETHRAHHTRSRLLPAAALVAALLFSIAINAQQGDLPDAPAPQWKAVQALSIGTPIVVRSGNSHVSCKFKNAAAESLSCVNSGQVELQRSSIRKVETYNRGASAALLAVAGARFGIAMVQLGNHVIGGRGDDVKPAVYAGGAGMGAFIFYPIGYFTHPIHHTIYKAQ